MSTPFSTTRSEQAALDEARVRLLRGDASGAEAILSAALAQVPHSFELRRTLAGVYQRTQRDQQTEALLHELLDERPQDVASAFTLTRMLIAQARTREAGQLLRHCFESGEHDGELAILAIELLNEADCQAEAAAIAEHAIAAAPNDPRLHAYAGMLQLQLGNFEGACAHYRFAWQNSLQSCEWHVPYGLASAQRYEDAAHPDFAGFRAALDSKNMSDKARSTLLFALGKAHDDVGDYQNAAVCFRQANALAHALTAWVRKDWRRAIEARLAAPPITYHCPADENFVPIFIVGMPRSGTTLLARLLARYPRASNRGELPWIGRLAQQPQVATTPTAAVLRDAAQLYCKHTRRDDANGVRWFIDKQPLNFRYLDLMLALFPNARIVFCQRNSRDTALSLWTQSFFEEVQGYAYDFSDIAQVMRDCARLMTHWRKRFPDSIHSLHYEDMVADPQAATDRLAAWLGFDEADSSASPPPGSVIRTASVWQARQPINAGSVGRWRNYVSHVPELLEFPSAWHDGNAPCTAAPT